MGLLTSVPDVKVIYLVSVDIAIYAIFTSAVESIHPNSTKPHQLFLFYTVNLLEHSHSFIVTM